MVLGRGKEEANGEEERRGIGMKNTERGEKMGRKSSERERGE